MNGEQAHLYFPGSSVSRHSRRDVFGLDLERDGRPLLDRVVVVLRRVLPHDAVLTEDVTVPACSLFVSQLRSELLVARRVLAEGQSCKHAVEYINY